MEFIDRPHRPIFAIERYIAGSDSYGNGFWKHNTNSGYVDLETRRKTPQVFSAHSFYASQGERLVADIQGVGDLFTDPREFLSLIHNCILWRLILVLEDFVSKVILTSLL